MPEAFLVVLESATRHSPAVLHMSTGDHDCIQNCGGGRHYGFWEGSDVPQLLRLTTPREVRRLAAEQTERRRASRAARATRRDQPSESRQGESRQVEGRPRIADALERLFARQRPSRTEGESNRQNNDRQLVRPNSEDRRREASTRRLEGGSRAQTTTHRADSPVASHTQRSNAVNQSHILMPVRVPRGNGDRPRR